MKSIQRQERVLQRLLF